jgi:hypothetical protein
MSPLAGGRPLRTHAPPSAEGRPRVLPARRHRPSRDVECPYRPVDPPPFPPAVPVVGAKALPSAPGFRYNPHSL